MGKGKREKERKMEKESDVRKGEREGRKGKGIICYEKEKKDGGLNIDPERRRKRREKTSYEREKGRKRWIRREMED